MSGNYLHIYWMALLRWTVSIPVYAIKRLDKTINYKCNTYANENIAVSFWF